jgi:hypothetical protein
MDQDQSTDEWACTMTLNIDEVRAMYDHFCYAIETWPGAPRRPVDEQIWLDIMKKRMFAMIVDYNFTEM